MPAHPPFAFEYTREGPLYTALWMYPMEAQVDWAHGGTYPHDEPYECALHARFGMRFPDRFASRMLAWAITSGRMRAVMPHYHRDEAAKALGWPVEIPDLVRWEYDFEAFEYGVQERDRGFVPGRSTGPISRRGTPAWASPSAEDHGEAGLFELDTLEQLHTLSVVLEGDPGSALSVYGLDPSAGRYSRFVHGMRGRARPSLEQMLHGDELFVHLAEGYDNGGVVALLVKSLAPLQLRMEGAAQRVRQLMESFFEATGEFEGAEQWEAALQRLTESV